MMDIIVTDAEAISRTVAAMLGASRPVVVVTLTDPGSAPPCLPLGVTEHLVLEAIDAEMPVEDWVGRFGGQESELFDDEDADALIDLARRHIDALVVVHCGQGVSRSTAAAAVIVAAADGVNMDDALAAARAAQERGFAWRDRRGFQPNSRVLEVGFARLASIARSSSTMGGTKGGAKPGSSLSA